MQRERIKIPRFLLASLAAVPHFLQPERPQRIDAESLARCSHPLAGCRKKIPSKAA
jgi:hypothetical protein